jgi:hypothetical protein
MAIGDSPLDDRARVLTTQRRRWEFLKRLYELNEQVRPGYIQSAPATEVAADIGVTNRGDVDRTLFYLKDAGLIKFMTMGPTVAITKAGIDAVERALAEPEKPTQYFGPINVLTIAGNVYGSQLQQGTRLSTQYASGRQVDWSSLKDLIPRLREAVVSLPDPQRKLVLADLDWVEAQSDAETPRLGAVRESLEAVRSVVQRNAPALADRLSTWLASAGLS